MSSSKRASSAAAAAESEGEKLERLKRSCRESAKRSRSKRKDEYERLKTDNEHLRAERLSFDEEIGRLELAVKEMAEERESEDYIVDQMKEANDESNLRSRLREELEIYRAFASACVQAKEFVVETSPKDHYENLIKNMITSGEQLAHMNVERLIAESVNWKLLKFKSSHEELNKNLTVRYQVGEGNALELRYDFAVERRKSIIKAMSKAYLNFWSKPEITTQLLESKLGLASFWMKKADNPISVEIAKSANATLYRVESTALNLEWAFIIGAREDDKPKSIVEPEALLVPGLLGVAGSSLSNTPVDELRGLVKCHSGARSTILLDSQSLTKKDCVRGRFVEGFRFWVQEPEMAEEAASSSSAAGFADSEMGVIRGVIVVSASDDFARTVFGDSMGLKMMVNFSTESISPIYQHLIDYLWSTLMKI